MIDYVRGWALITGASAGIGAEFARQLAAEGYALILVARRLQRLNELKIELQEKVPVEILALDLSKPDAGTRLEKFCEEQEIQVDLLVNNAGFGSCGRFAELDLNRELEMVDLNIRSMLELSHRFVKRMIERGSGKILIVASCGGFQPGPGMNTYFATKGFDLHFAEALDEELSGTGVRCSVLCPGPTATEFFDVAGAKSLKATPIPSMNVKDVVRYTLKKMDQGHRVIIPGVLNQLASLCYRFFPRRLITSLLGRVLLHRSL
tara:strand:- start:2322 stop:3110 length:789 start_codon:yes stop_codon:yes gene_type:complete